MKKKAHSEAEAQVPRTKVPRIAATRAARKPRTVRDGTGKVSLLTRHNLGLNLVVIIPQRPEALALLATQTTHLLVVPGAPAWSWPVYRRRKS